MKMERKLKAQKSSWYLIFLLSTLLGQPCVCQAQHYTNPVLTADYSDPDVCVGPDGFYLTASSFCASPGLPVLFSTDLVHWSIVNHALPVVPNADYEPESDVPVKHGRCVWAPSIRWHDGWFYIYYGDPDYGIYMTCTTNPRGVWSRPVLVVPGRGLIDPCPLWDDDGKVYLVHAWANSRAGINSCLVVQELDSTGTRVLNAPVMVYDGTQDRASDAASLKTNVQQVNHTVEGPKFYKRGDYYYIFAPAGGVETGWQLALRSRSVYGPYVSRVVMAQGTSAVNGPHQGAWVETAGEENWFFHFQESQPYGRIVHLQPMIWRDGWPVIGEDPDGDGCGQPVDEWQLPHTGFPASRETLRMQPQTDDDFAGTTLGQQWEWQANYQPLFGFTTNAGYFRLFTHRLSADEPNLWNVPNLLLQKFPKKAFTATACVRVVAKEEGQRGGLLVMGLDYAWLSLVRRGEQFVVQLARCRNAGEGGVEQTEDIAVVSCSRIQPTGNTTNYECLVYLRVQVENGGRCQFSYSLDGRRFSAAGSAFQAREGKWVGAKIGLAAVSADRPALGWMDCDWFRVE